MKYIIVILFTLLSISCLSQEEGKLKKAVKKTFKYSTFYGAISGSNSIANRNVYSVTNGLQTDIVETPFDYAFTVGVRKVARFGYENRANVFYDGTEKSYGDAATVGKITGLEFLSEVDLIRQQGKEFLNQDHFLRYVAKHWVAKVEYLQDNIADITYFEGSQRARININKKLSFNAGTVQRISEPYGYNPLTEWKLANNSIHYTALAIQEGYNMNVNTGQFFDPDGNLVAENTEVWEAVVIPQVLEDYVSSKRKELSNQWVYSVVLGYDFYHYTDNFWMHTWGNLLPYHLDTKKEFSYHSLNDDSQWLDYSGGIVFGNKFNRSLGIFLEGKYHKYWDRTWYDFSVGINYIIF